VTQTSSIGKFADLKGERIALTKGAGSHDLLLAALAKAGLTFKDISPAYLPPAEGRAVFVGDYVDARVARIRTVSSSASSRHFSPRD
jgi:sulfonate transport system substrate-binding protein